MLTFIGCVVFYLLMIFVTRAIYEASLEAPPPRWSSGGRMDEARWLVPIAWPIGLPLIAGEFVGKIARKALSIINDEEGPRL